jgi:catechol 2,3-dioxygenase-like lactoylglutathione lyase family enzyme
MITRFDHAVIAVRDLESATQQYQKLGFEVRPGGKHTGRGTYNALIRFGLDYLELISIYDREELGARQLNGATLAEFLDRNEGGLVGYALAAQGIEQEAARLQQAGVEAEGPFAMQRQRPDGRVLSWQLLVPGGTPWRRPWPFLIQWDTPDEQRLTWEQPGTHPNGASGVDGLRVLVRDLEAATALYQQQLGLTLAGRDEARGLGAELATFQMGSFKIELLAPAGAGMVQTALDAQGEGLYELLLKTRDMNQTLTTLAEQGVGVQLGPAGTMTALIQPEQALGARIALSAQG